MTTTKSRMPLAVILASLGFLIVYIASVWVVVLYVIGSFGKVAGLISLVTLSILGTKLIPPAGIRFLASRYDLSKRQIDS